MIYPTGKIEIISHYNPLTGGIERLDFKWEGGNTVQISDELLSNVDRSIVKYKRYPPLVGDKIMFGPFQLKLLEQDWGCASFTCVRVDSLSGYLIYYWHRSCKLLDVFYRRLIITAVVWDCASHVTGVSVSWRDLYLVQYIQKIYARLMTYSK